MKYAGNGRYKRHTKNMENVKLKTVNSLYINNHGYRGVESLLSNQLAFSICCSPSSSYEVITIMGYLTFSFCWVPDLQAAARG